MSCKRKYCLALFLAAVYILACSACGTDPFPQVSVEPYIPTEDSGDLHFYGIVKNGDVFCVRVLEEYREEPCEEDFGYVPLAEAIYAYFQPDGWLGAWCPSYYYTAQELALADLDKQITLGARFAYGMNGGCMEYLAEHNYYAETEPGEIEKMPPEADLPVAAVPALLPDVLSLREKEYPPQPSLATEQEVAEYALWNFLWGRTEFECFLPPAMAVTEGDGYAVLSRACENMQTYFLFSAYTEYDMYTEYRDQRVGVYAKVKLIFEKPEWDLEARAEALEYVMKNPPPAAGFTDFESEREYARGIHDYLACKVTYAPIGYTPEKMFGLDRYTNKQEAYTALGEDQSSTVCAGYARAFALIAQYAGINAAWIRGNVTEDGGHAWNILYPCDKSEPVLIDVTWDDGASEDTVGQSEVDHSWFYVPLSQDVEHVPLDEMAGFLDYLNGADIGVG